VYINNTVKQLYYFVRNNKNDIQLEIIKTSQVAHVFRVFDKGDNLNITKLSK